MDLVMHWSDVHKYKSDISIQYIQLLIFQQNKIIIFEIQNQIGWLIIIWFMMFHLTVGIEIYNWVVVVLDRRVGLGLDYELLWVLNDIWVYLYERDQKNIEKVLLENVWEWK